METNYWDTPHVANTTFRQCNYLDNHVQGSVLTLQVQLLCYLSWSRKIQTWKPATMGLVTAPEVLIAQWPHDKIKRGCQETVLYGEFRNISIEAIQINIFSLVTCRTAGFRCRTVFTGRLHGAKYDVRILHDVFLVWRPHPAVLGGRCR